MRIRIDMEYDGAGFYGWQRQPGMRTIQGTIEEVLEEVAGRRVPLHGAGRTDSGVHAMQQVAHFSCDSRFPPHKWVPILNSKLPESIRVQRAMPISEDFDANRSALTKIYWYRVRNLPMASALDRRVTFFPRPLDWGRIGECLPFFLGEKDFKAFQGAKATVKTTVRDIRRFTLHEEASGIYRFEIEGTGFLKQMVRNIIGTVLEVGEGRREAEDIPRILASRDRRQAGKTAPAAGLVLAKIYYPQRFETPD